MRKALVIADDLSGAAEVAGIGHRYGLPTRLVRRPPVNFDPGLTVIDTDTRLLPPADAAAAVIRFTAEAGVGVFDLIYKKSDSVLRGPVAAELDALLPALGRTSALLAPQNPSLGRVIVGGEYYIDGLPLHETPFASDPTHPRWSSDVAELLGTHRHVIRIAAGASADDLRKHAAKLPADVLPAGGADFFIALLEERGLPEKLTEKQPFLGHTPAGPALFVCGSTAPSPFIPGVATRPMMDATDAWRDAVCALLEGGEHAMMTIDRPLDRSPGAAAQIERTMAAVAAAVLRRCPVRTVLITGGATAVSVCRAMGWDEFEVEGELASGVVQLRPTLAGAPRLVIKPGSYPWPPQLGGMGEVSLRRLDGG
ncbi:MAG TPA: four-carbon acid sugar kinase family protein [Tepidisphaeraceae bacterium]|nr:four-carbon acid sugar kinase family protein [Tepidisphaeraceae bacterium]